jgi:hypothetical protein
MNLNTAIALQERDFIRAFHDPSAYPVAVQDPRQAARALSVNAGFAWDVSGKTFVRTVNGQFKEYWAHVDFQDYRKAFLGFAKSSWSVPPQQLTDALHVDHVVNRGFARDVGLAYVRLALLPRTINIRYGAKIEKNLSRLEKAGQRVVFMDYLCLMKVLGILPPGSWDNYSNRRDQIATVFMSKGVAGDRGLLLQGMDGFFSLWKVL